MIMHSGSIAMHVCVMGALITVVAVSVVEDSKHIRQCVFHSDYLMLTNEQT